MNDLKDILVNIGAIAGFAGLVGLAVLAMLYFSQARDVRRLREWAGREPERAAEVELRASQIASQAIAQAYETMDVRQAEAQAAASVAQEHHEAEALETAAQTGEVYVAVDPGEGSEVDELAAAEAGEQPAIEITPVEQPSETELAPVGEQAEQQVEHDEHAVLAEAAPAPGEQAAAPPSPPVPADDEFGGSAVPETRPSRLAPSTPAATRSGPLPPLPPLDTSDFQAARSPLPPLSDTFSFEAVTESAGAGGYSSTGRPAPDRPNRVPFVIAGILVTVFGALLVFSQFNGNDPTPAKTPAEKRAERDRRASSTSTAKRNERVNRPAVTVSVLNGTNTPGLAGIVGDQLIQSGFTETTTGNRNDGQNHVTSVVYYVPGSKLEAEEVAKELDIKSVREIDPETQAQGGSAPVVVVLGADIEQ